MASDTNSKTTTPTTTTIERKSQSPKRYFENKKVKKKTPATATTTITTTLSVYAYQNEWSITFKKYSFSSVSFTYDVISNCLFFLFIYRMTTHAYTRTHSIHSCTRTIQTHLAQHKNSRIHPQANAYI